MLLNAATLENFFYASACTVFIPGRPFCDRPSDGREPRPPGNFSRPNTGLELILVGSVRFGGLRRGFGVETSFSI